MYGINIQVNGKQVEDLWQEWNARTREVEKLKRDNERMRAQLKECGEVIKKLKEEKEDLVRALILSSGEFCGTEKSFEDKDKMREILFKILEK